MPSEPRSQGAKEPSQFKRRRRRRRKRRYFLYFLFHFLLSLSSLSFIEYLCAPSPTPSMLKVSRPVESLTFNAVSSSPPSSFGLPIAYPERIVRLRGKSNVTVGWPSLGPPEFQTRRSMDQQIHQKPGLAINQQSSQRAPSYHVPQLSVVSVEHPFIIRNVGKAIDMLGGLPRVNSVRNRAISIH